MSSISPLSRHRRSPQDAGTPSTARHALPGWLPTSLHALLERADIRINGGRPWDPQVHDRRFWRRVALHRSLGLGEAYMDGWWDCEALDQFICRLLVHGGGTESQSRWRDAGQWLWQALVNRQSLRRAPTVAHRHYDLGNDLFQRMLDPTMSYSCGYWRRAHTLDEAQTHKLDLICRKLQLTPGMTLLDIGCGWGGLLHHAATHYGVQGLGVTLSGEQADIARERCRGLPVEIRVQDYRTLQGHFDRIVSVGMFEHVGRRNYATYFRTCERLLEPDGLTLLHTIGSNSSSHGHDPWIDRYIFPNGELPSVAQIATASQAHFVTEDVHGFGPDYARTLRAWDTNFRHHWPEIAPRYDERFYRMWRYYLNSCAGAFDARDIQLWQWVFSPFHRRAAYQSVR
ncbi:cyclopropane fatty acyl phospholipid synthase [Isoalcanivorax pacificus W11-5]|uniref:Cyclopropane fatty acyl phospholipid synthase n=1 Tax=Isoalcanivorax pacificus W11-5 TaxID=391936 RepID=A0A0B4XRZ6_9GAMM|nr:cyclopropane fatty acyl phospholipid synthase [Isoalcanivorax pacificus]AJD49540.1 cyclopropane fatty acyl phospholipid synthase [Isoalcanivorax pacificus W11-5]